MRSSRSLLFTAVCWLLVGAACSTTATNTPTFQPTEYETEVRLVSEEAARPTSTAKPETTELETELDLRYANVTGVEFEHLNDSEYRFDVTLYHDDDGEAPNFADAWQVEDLQGNLLGRRELLHSHGTQPFTRSQTFTIPSAIKVVLVRGHDMTHGFGGQGMRVDLISGETSPVQLEAEQ